ncbi:hypothetical protein KAFR_0J01980 [Kazachstania africana CBS 2517]|uniref:[PSI+] induction protein 2 n=1 Tax=Kazachstania africana (strain ATCC 22294 / BCRC 22015 / CBS 2517 / CECT 1963 / NBRC 1671 / NRRL Y-8276) TaxID=1071382 RepID=H2B0W2_KAZAF|nr:hypothetical protein KAFR_0J01980 [Kazachstania africana CBS 2517]CCF60262.1 hypothetical protein KAFR_0J01980 [Kazachstania africana CBS 2517]
MLVCKVTQSLGLNERSVKEDLESFKSWDTCMDDKACKIVAIVGIVLACIVVIWLIGSLLTCFRQGVGGICEFICWCSSCYKNRSNQNVNQAYQPAQPVGSYEPATIIYQPVQPPQSMYSNDKNDGYYNEYGNNGSNDVFELEQTIDLDAQKQIQRDKEEELARQQELELQREAEEQRKQEQQQELEREKQIQKENLLRRQEEIKRQIEVQRAQFDTRRQVNIPGGEPNDDRRNTFIEMASPQSAIPSYPQQQYMGKITPLQPAAAHSNSPTSYQQTYTSPDAMHQQQMYTQSNSNSNAPYPTDDYIPKTHNYY